jgi:hypothetical protein
VVKSTPSVFNARMTAFLTYPPAAPIFPRTVLGYFLDCALHARINAGSIIRHHRFFVSARSIIVASLPRSTRQG